MSCYCYVCMMGVVVWIVGLRGREFCLLALVFGTRKLQACFAAGGGGVELHG